MKNKNFYFIILLFCFFLFHSKETKGQQWKVISSGTKARLTAVTFPTKNIGYIVGQTSTILKTTDTGATWQIVPCPKGRNIQCVSFINKDSGWIGCDSGKVFFTKDGGNNWTLQSVGVSTTISNINFLKNGNGYATGPFGTVYRSNNYGANWTQQKPVYINYSSNFMFDSANIWITGTCISGKEGTLVKSTDAGKTWATITNTNGIVGANYYDVQFTSKLEGWLIGAKGIIRYTNDGGATTWVTQTSGTANDLSNLCMLDNKTGWICGKSGFITSTKDGSKWNAENSGVTSILWGISFTDSEHGIAVGDSGVILKYGKTVNTKPLQLLTPNGGQLWQVMSIQNIIWAAKGVSKINIFVSTNNGGNWTGIASNVDASTGSYAWTVPNTLSRNCLVRIIDVSSGAKGDTSDATFTIINKPVGIDYTVLLTARVQKSPAEITLNWVNDPNADEYSIYKKLPADTVWAFQTKTAGTTNSWKDISVSVGKRYEYQVMKKTALLTAYGYISSGIEIPEVGYRGIFLLLVDSNFDSPLATELNQYEVDLIADGWQVVRKVFNPSTVKVTEIKSYIKSQYNAKPTEVKAVLLFGHLPTPYSGNYAPDGHAERVGAQPADVYYADMDGNWTDATTTTTNKGTIYTPNVPGDGKFDQSFIPGEVELMLGRVDMNNMGGFALSEKDLLKQYLIKNHDFRFKTNNPQGRALVYNQMDVQMPVASPVGYMSFCPMFGDKNIKSVSSTPSPSTFMDSLKSNNYLWAYVGGGGQDTAINNTVISSYQLEQNKINVVFMQIFGSYFVEWNRGPNNMLRAPLANAGMPLTSCWTGPYPYWYFHHMAMGEPIGKSVMLSENNAGLYALSATQLAKGIHMELMGDPGLCLHIVNPVSSLKLQAASSSVSMNWTASTDNNIVGYNVYRSSTLKGKFSKVNGSLITSSSFTDSFPLSGNNVYLVRAVKLESTPSGTYFNMSEGILDSIKSVIGIHAISNQKQTLNCYPNPFNKEVNIELNSEVSCISITDITGKKVLSSQIPKSSTTFTWNAKEQKTGIYFLQAYYADKTTSTQKLILVE